MEKKKFKYGNDELTVYWEKDTCQHAAVCVKGLPGVFDVNARPWINVEGASPQEIMDLIGKCPSGALSYEYKGQSSEGAVTASAVEITLFPNGPLGLSGNVVIKDGSGNVIAEKDKCALCRCGQSANKPYCDGTHSRVGWTE